MYSYVRIHVGCKPTVKKFTCGVRPDKSRQEECAEFMRECIPENPKISVYIPYQTLLLDWPFRNLGTKCPRCAVAVPVADFRHAPSDFSLSPKIEWRYTYGNDQLGNFYPQYMKDCFIEISDEVAEVLRADKLYEAAPQRRVTRNKAQYSLDWKDMLSSTLCSTRFLHGQRLSNPIHIRMYPSRAQLRDIFVSLSFVLTLSFSIRRWLMLLQPRAEYLGPRLQAGYPGHCDIPVIEPVNSPPPAPSL